MQRTNFGDMHCSIARALDVLGEPWTPLILRDLLLGFTQFEELRKDLGISTNVLTDRLAVLVDNGVVERRPLGPHPNHFEYELTDKGRDAVPVLLALLAWGDRWETGRRGLPTEILHTSCGHLMTAVAHCSACGDAIDLDDLEYHKGPGSTKGPGTELLRDHLGPRIDDARTEPRPKAPRRKAR